MSIPQYCSSKVAAAALLALQSDADLVAYFTGGIVAAQNEQIYMEEASFTPPSLVVTVGARTHEPMPSQRWDLVVPIEVAIIESARSSTVENFSFLDVVDHVIVTLYGSEAGQLRDAGGSLVTEGLTRFAPPKASWAPGASQFRTILRATYQSYVGSDMQFEA